jgi:hypothetical protein
MTVLTNLIPVIYQAADRVSRELTGLIPAVTLNATAEMAAKDQTITYPVSPVGAAADIAAAATGPDPSESTIGSGSMSISKSRGVTFYWTGEEQMSVSGLYETILRDQFAQAMRTLCNEVENDLAGLYLNASRGAGSSGSAPFGTAGDYMDAANVRRILVDNGAPTSDLQLVLNTAAGANLRGKQGGRGVEAEGTTSLLRQGVLQDIHGFAVRESAQIRSHTAGSFSSGTLTSAVRAVGATSLAATADYTAGLAAGDMITLAHESNAHAYMITAVAAGSITIAAPGLRTATAATGTVAITKIATGARNLAFARSAIHLLARQPAMPAGGDAADDVQGVTDPNSGLTFQVAMYRQRRRVAFEVGLAWGVKAVKTEHLAILLG